MKKLYFLMVVAGFAFRLAATQAPVSLPQAVPVDEALADLPTSKEDGLTVFRGRKEDRCLNHALWILLRATAVLKDATWPANPLVFPATPREGSDPKLQFFQELDTTQYPLLSDARADEQCKAFSLKRLEHELLWMIRRNQEISWPYCPEACRIRHFAMWEAIESLRREREKKADLERRTKKLDADLPVVTDVAMQKPSDHTTNMMPEGARVAASMHRSAHVKAQ
jgi:hypothetical protein